MPRILIITNLFPNPAEPNRGMFNARQFVALAEHCEIEIIAPTAWRSAAGRMLTPEQRQVRFPTPFGDLLVHHPQYYYTPGMLRFLYPKMFLRCIMPMVRKRWQARPFDLVFGTWMYPDCVAAARVAATFNVPFLARNHGSDIHLHATHLLRRGKIAEAAIAAKRVFCVSAALAKIIANMTNGRARTEFLPNGIDPEEFSPLPREEARRRLGLATAGKKILFVGNLVAVKGLDYLVKALGRMRAPGEWQVHIIGKGKLRRNLQQWARDAAIAPRLRLEGEQPHEKIPLWINAADVLVLPSLNEGCPNVLLESQCCGTPVVATCVGAVPDITNAASAVIVQPRDAVALANAIENALGREWDRAAVRRVVAGFTWQKNAARIYAAVQQAIG